MRIEMTRTPLLTLLLLATLLVGCNRLKLYNFSGGEVVASVGDKELYLSQMAGMIDPTLSPEDSAAAARLIIENWVRRELKAAAAEAALPEGQTDIDTMVAAYRASLLSYRYEQQWLSSRMDTVVTSQQITEYYRSHSDDLRLPGPIVKARVARLPVGLRQSNKLEEMFRSDRQSDWDDFNNICQKNGYRVDDFSEWIDFGAVVLRLPFPYGNFDEFLRQRKYYEVEDDQYKYMLLITSYLPAGELSPVELERENIRKVILNKRRQALLTHLEDSLYRQGVQFKQFKINTKE